MSIASISSLINSLPSQVQTDAQARIDLQALKSDLQSGNITNAEQDFATLLKDSPRFQTELQANASTPQASALSSLSSALQAGNLTAAQTAASTLQATMWDARHPIHAHSLGAVVAATAAKPSLGLTL
jgi:hypothetical protein